MKGYYNFFIIIIPLLLAGVVLQGKSRSSTSSAGNKVTKKFRRKVRMKKPDDKNIDPEQINFNVKIN